MGRRKIAIEPITHGRNRAVTFLKRKNGLFKKAYELGVLCSVDVAVIIFEGRSGHDLKLHSYCSVDLHDMAQRELRFQGERDSRGPTDFSSRFDDVDDEEYEEEGPSRPGKRKQPSDNLGTPANVSTSNMPGYLSHHNDLHLPNMAMAGAPPGHYDNGASPSIGSLMPISNDRVSNLRSSTRAKRQRINDPVPSRSRSPSVEQDHLQTSEGVRQIHAPPAMVLQAHPNPYHPQQQYALFPMGAPGAIHMGLPHGPHMVPPPPPRFEPQYDPALYGHQYPPSMIRQTPGDVGNRDGSGSGSQPANESPHQPSHPSATQRERGGGEMFTAFLEAHERKMAATASPIPQSRPQQVVNWPASSPIQGNASDPASSNDNSNHGNQPAGTTTTRPTTENWFELFANATTTTATATTTAGGGDGSANAEPRVQAQLAHLSAEIAHMLASAPVPPGGSGPGEEHDDNDASSIDTTNTEQRPTTTRRIVRVVDVDAADEEDEPRAAQKEEDEEDDDDDDEVIIVEDVRPRANVPPNKKTSVGDDSNGQPVKAPTKRGRGRPRGSGGSRGKAKGS